MHSIWKQRKNKFALDISEQVQRIYALMEFLVPRCIMKMALEKCHMSAKAMFVD